MNKLLAGLRRALPIVEADPQEAPRAAGGAVAENSNGKPMFAGEIVAMLEADLQAVIRLVHTASKRLEGHIHATEEDCAHISADAQTLLAAAGVAKQSTEALAGATSQMSASAAMIGEQVAHANDLTNQAIETGSAASENVETLRNSTADIGSVVEIIDHIAKQTNLLALNATIEAARAGAMGKGFAIVASEVKNLAGQTQKATAEISQKVERLRQDSLAAIDAVGHIVELIRQIQPVFDAVAGSVTEQTAATEELVRTANQTAAFADDVVHAAQSIDDATQKARASVEQAAAASHDADAVVEKLGTRFTTIIRQSPIGDRRRHERIPVNLPVVVAGAHDVPGKTLDLSEGGCLVQVPQTDLFQSGQTIVARIAGFGDIPSRIVAISPLGLHCQFVTVTAMIREKIQQLIINIREENAEKIELAQRTANEIMEALERAIRAGQASLDDLLDTQYEPIAGTNPQQFTTRGLKVLESALEPIQDRVAAATAGLAFCACIDRNAYLPVHNPAYRQPQRPDDPVWNAANCRNKRIFDDRAGLSAGRNTQPYLVQTYARDMGGGKIVMMKEVDVPIRIRDRHWGGLRMAYFS